MNESRVEQSHRSPTDNNKQQCKKKNIYIYIEAIEILELLLKHASVDSNVTQNNVRGGGRNA